MKQVHIRAFSLLLTLFVSIPLGLFAYADRSDLSAEATVSADSSLDVPYSVAQHGETETITATLQGESLDEADTPFQASTELSVDDGSFETALGLNQPGTIYLINRLRPPSYPATLVQLRIPFRTNDNLTVGSSITLLVGTNPDGDANIDGTSFQQFSGTIQSLGQFNLYNTPAVTINAGDFVVGFRMTIPANVFPGALDTSSPSRRSYASTNGVNFTLVDDINNNVPDGDLGIRAIVNLQTSSAQTGALLASYVSNNDTGTGDLTTIRDLTTGQLGTTILTQGNNAEVVVAPNGQYALALPTGNGDSVSIITGLNQPNPVESRVLPIGNTPNAAAITPDSSTAIVFNAFTNPVSYRIISNLPFNPSVSPLFTIPNTVTGNNSGVEDVALSPSGDTAIVSLFDDDEVAIIDGIRSGSPFVRGRVDVRDGPNGVAFGPDGNTAFVACSLDDSICVVSGLQQGVQPFFVRRIRDNVRDTPQAIALVPGRSRIIVTNTGDNSVSIFRIVGNGDDLQHVQRLSVGSAPAGLDVSQDGSAALVANANSRTVSVLRGIDTSSPYVAATLGGSSPWDTAVFAERSIAFVSGVTGTGGGILDVSTTSLTFNTQVGDTTPPSQQFLVRNTGNSAFSYSISNNNPSLVTFSPDSGFLQPGQSNVITVFVTPPTSAGTRQAVLTVSAPGAQNSPRTVTVIVNTTGAPAILDVSPTSLTFNTQVGGGNPPAQSFLVRNIGSGSFTYSISNSDPSLVSFSPSSGTVFGGQSQTVTVFVSNPNQAGTRQAVLTVSAPGAQNSPRTVTVIVNTTGAPAILDVSPTSLTFNTQVGGGNPPAQSFLVRNIGSGSFTYSISNSDPSLVSFSPSSGTVFGGQSQTVTVFVSNPNQAGTRQAVLTVSAPGAQNSPRTVTVTVNTTGAPAILDVSPTSLTFNTQVGDTTPVSQTFLVRNIGSGSFFYSISNSNPGLVSLSPDSGTVFGGQQQTVTVFVTPPTTAGTRQATLTINAPGAQNSPRTVIVTVNTTSAPAVLNVFPSSLTFVAVVGQGNPPPQPITVQNTGGGSLTFTITTSGAPVSVAESSGTLLAGQSRSVPVSVINPNTPGTTTSQLIVSAPGAQNSPFIVNITIITNPGGGIDPNEPNNNPQSATLLNVPSSGQSLSITGAGTPDDLGTNLIQLIQECGNDGLIQDWFRLNVFQRDAFRFTLSSPTSSADFDLYLFQEVNNPATFPDGVQLMSSSTLAAGQQDVIGSRVLEPGTYFLGVRRVRRNDSSDVQSANYTLTVARSQSPELHVIEDVACVGFRVDDDSTNNYYVVNRVRPTSYPARLEAISALFFPHEGRPSPSGRTVRMIAFIDPSGSGTPPANPSLVVNQLLTISLPGDGRGRFNTLNLGSSGPVINSGDFYVGYIVDTNNGIFPDAGRVLNQSLRSFVSTNNGQTYQILNIEDPSTGRLFNVAIRATVNTRPFGKASAEAPSELSGRDGIEAALPRNLSVNVQQ